MSIKVVIEVKFQGKKFMFPQATPILILHKQLFYIKFVSVRLNVVFSVLHTDFEVGAIKANRLTSEFET